jgi:hypothetical protein
MAHEFKHLTPDFPTDAAQHLIDYLMGVETDLCCVLDCSVGLLRYGGYLLAAGICPHGKAAPLMTTADKIDKLKTLTSVGNQPIGIDWNTIILLVMQIIQELLSSPTPIHKTACPPKVTP